MLAVSVVGNLSAMRASALSSMSAGGSRNSIPTGRPFLSTSTHTNESITSTVWATSALLKRDVGGVSLGVVPDDHNVRLPFMISIGDGDNDVRICRRHDNFQTATCFGGAEKSYTVLTAW